MIIRNFPSTLAPKKIGSGRDLFGIQQVIEALGERIKNAYGKTKDNFYLGCEGETRQDLFLAPLVF